MTAQIKQLNERLSRLRMARVQTEMSDDFAYTNGNIRKIEREMSAVRAELARLGVAA